MHLLPSRASFRMRGRGTTLLANHSHSLKPWLKHWLHVWLKSLRIFIERRVPFLSEGAWLFAGESFKGLGFWRYWSWLHHRSVDLVVFLVLISCCHPVSQPSKRGGDTFVGESFGDDRGNLVGLFSLMMGIVYISALQSCLLDRKFFLSLDSCS